MIKQFVRINLLSTSNNLTAICRYESNLATAPKTKLKYDLFGAICLERHPVITKPLNELQKRYIKHLQEVEYRKSLKNNFELRAELEVKEAEMIKKGLLEINLDKVVTQTTADIIEAGDKAFKEFQFAPRITEADEKNEVTSLDRKLDKNLLLLVQQNLGDQMYWIPPQTLRQDGETIRDTADRALRDTCGDVLSVKIYGNAPIGVYKYLYPKKLREKLQSDGAKVFYFLAEYIGGPLSSKLKYQWVDRSEMKQMLPTKVYKSVSRFLIPE